MSSETGTSVKLAFAAVCVAVGATDWTKHCRTSCTPTLVVAGQRVDVAELAVFRKAVQTTTTPVSCTYHASHTVYQSINQSKHISIAPYVASESEAHDL